MKSKKKKEKKKGCFSLKEKEKRKEEEKEGECGGSTMNSGTRRFYQSNESFQLERGLGRERERVEGGNTIEPRVSLKDARVQSIHARPAER